MVDNLNFLRVEATKLQKELEKTNAKKYKKYATLLQAYLTEVGNVNQLEAIQKQRAEEQKRKQEEERILKEAQKEIDEEKNKNPKGKLKQKVKEV